MPREARHQSRNVHLSVLDQIGEGVTLAGALYPGLYAVLHESAWRDVEGVRLPAEASQDAWVETSWTDQSAGAGGYSTLQAVVYSRAGNDRTAVTRDEYGVRAELIAETLVEIFMGRDPVTKQGRFNVPVLDFSAAGPPFPDTGGRLICEDLGGRWGSPVTRQKDGIRGDGLWRWTLRWNFRMVRDAQSPAAHYTD